MKTALILVDIQNDYFPGGRMELEGSTEAGARAGEVLAFFRSRGLPLVHVQHLAIRPDATFFLPGTRGAEIHESVKPLSGEIVVQKNFPNSFRGTTLTEQLRTREISSLVIAGMMTHMCIDATTRAAFDLGLECTVLHDACATRGLSFGSEVVPARYVHGAFLAALGAVYARVISCNEWLTALR